MHIGTGKFEGKKIKDTPEGITFSTRFLTMKESIFEIIGIRIHEASVLDVNDRNGMYGIEALSKGATAVHFLNLHKEDRDLVRKNLLAVDLDPNEYVLDISPRDFFKNKPGVYYDVIFFRAVDSHCLEMLEKVLSLQSENGITILTFVEENDCKLINPPEGYQVIDTRSIETEKCMVIIKKK